MFLGRGGIIIDLGADTIIMVLDAGVSTGTDTTGPGGGGGVAVAEKAETD